MAVKRSGPVDGSPAEATVLITVQSHGSIARADIARASGLSSAAVTRAVKALMDDGYLEEHDPRAQEGEESRLGRPSTPLRVNPTRTGAFGMKITEDEVFGVLCDLTGQIRVSRAVPLASDEPDAVLAVVVDLYRRLREDAAALPFAEAPRNLGVAIAGDVDRPTGTSRYSPFLHWRDVPFGRMLADALGAPVVIENDVRALTVSEQWFGMGRGTQNFLVLTLGSGVGGGLVVDGSVVRGQRYVSGEIGHIPVGDPARTCYSCGARGCVEAVASTRGLLESARAATGRGDLTSAELIERARAGDETMLGVLRAAGTAVGKALASAANIVGPERIIVAGEGSTLFDLMETEIRAAFAEHAYGAVDRAEIHVRELPFEEWAHGAAAVALEELVYPTR